MKKLLLESPRLYTEKHPKRSSTSSSHGAYILHITSLPSSYAASSSSPSTNAIDLFDKSSLRIVQTLRGHNQGTTSLYTQSQTISGVLNQRLISSGKDGCIKIWDERSNSCVIQMTNEGLGPSTYGYLCSDISPDGMTIAGGTEMRGEDAFIAYWDPRQPVAPLRTHGSTHSDDITSLFYHPDKEPSTGRTVILSASTDGLLSTSYADEDDEDEATIQVGNWGSSISQAGWIDLKGDDGQGAPSAAAIWAASDMETFSTWTTELDRRMEVDIRAPGSHTWTTDYLIKAHNSSTCTPKLSVFTGNNSGDVALLSNTNPSSPDAPWCLHGLWRRGHEGIVRGLFWDESTQVLVTGGEDSRLNAWNINIVDADEMEEDDDREERMVTDSPSSPKRKREMKEGFVKKGKKAKREDSWT